MRSKIFRRALLLAAALSLLSQPSTAGQRELELGFVPMTADATASDAAKTCLRQLEAALKDNDSEIVLQRIPVSALRKQASKLGGDAFLSWTAAALRPAKSRGGGTDFDTLILVDCRPESRQLDVLIDPASEGLVRLELRELPLDRGTLTWVADAIKSHAWNGFSP